MKAIKYGFFLGVLASVGLGCHKETAETPLPVLEEQQLQWANPLVGTGGHGHTTPSAAMPFGMVQLGPDTRLEGWDGCGGYHHSDSMIYGFSHTHLSGTGVSDYGDVLLCPAKWDPAFNFHQNPISGHPFQLSFSHSQEKVEPGFYSVQAFSPDRIPVNVRLTATDRVGIHEYTYDRSQMGMWLMLPFRDRVTASEIRWTTPTRIEGYRHSTAWAKDQRLWFCMEFSQPLDTVRLILGDREKPEIRIAKQGEWVEGKSAFAFLKWNGGDDPLLVKVGISAVDADGARRNLEKEALSGTFDEFLGKAQAAWAGELGKIKIAGTDEVKANFYSALYHTCFQPNLFSDDDGRFRGMDQHIHQADQTRVYSVFSLWDTFRAAHPLYTLVQKARTREFIQTFLYQYQQGGRLPVWELAANETDCMIGYHSVSVIADAYLKGELGFDPNLALEAMIHSADLDHFGLADYKAVGYIRGEMEAESVSKTLEYAYDDWCIAMMAKKMGRSDVYELFMKRAQNWKNVFDQETGFLRARMNGLPFAPFAPSEVNFHYTEANAWQYSLFVPQDINGLMHFMGGPRALEKHLDSLFAASSQTTGRDQADITGLIGQYAHGNEPSHHMAYLYNFCGKPWKTQQRVRQILREQYYPTPDGLSGNEDCGQMSAWYVLSALGLYQVTPGIGYYVIGSPVVSAAEMDLGDGKKLKIVAENQSEDNVYVQSVTLNGRNWPKSYVPHDSIAKGCEIRLVMGAQPNEKWAADSASCPVAAITDFPQLPVPQIRAKGRTFADSMEVAISLPSAVDGRIYFTTDGSEPTVTGNVYTSRFWVKQNTVVKARAFRPDWGETPVAEVAFYKLDPNRKIISSTEYASQYNGGGPNALADGLLGGNDFRTGGWQGFREDVNIVLDLGEAKSLHRLYLNCLQDQNSWIFMPQSVSFDVSTDNMNWKEVGRVVSMVKDTQEGSIVRPFSVKWNGKARYIRVRAKQYGKLPAWHLGAGGDSWIFADELGAE